MKNVTCSVIEKVPNDWSIWRKVIDREKYLNYDKSKFPDEIEFCIEVLENDKFKLLERIGSSSADAEVYKIRVDDMEFALKLMPRVDSDSEKRNRNEIETAYQASEYPDYFPLTFAYGYCPETSYYLGMTDKISSFIPRAIEYKSICDMLNIIENKGVKKRFESDYRNGMNLEELKYKYNIKLMNNKIQVDFLISELANGDLGSWMRKERNIQDWRKMLIDVMTGIYYLTVILNKVYPDLHPGNVLILKTKNGIKALIHDFGRCYSVDENVPATYKATLLSFCQEFISCANTRDDLIIPREISIVVQDVLKVVNSLDVNSTNIQNIYEEIIFPIITNQN
jgi:hypothetical protein